MISTINCFHGVPSLELLLKSLRSCVDMCIHLLVSDVIKAVDAQATFIKSEEQVSSYKSGVLSHKFEYGNGSSACQLIPEEFQSPWKAKKVSRSNLTSSKRARLSQIDGFSGTTAIDDFKDMFKKSLKRSISLGIEV